MNALSTIETLLRNPGTQIDAADFIGALVMSVVSALFVTGLYHVFYEERATGSRIHRSFLLISPSITALFIAIQFSLPLSLGLVGALTIIRFRTPIKEPEEVAFIMLVIATSIVCATFHYLLLIVLLGFSLLVLLIQRFIPRLLKSKKTDGVMLLAIGGDANDSTKKDVLHQLRKRLSGLKIQSLSISNGITTIHVSFRGMKPEQLDGLESDLKEVSSIQKISVYFNRQGILD